MPLLSIIVHLGGWEVPGRLGCTQHRRVSGSTDLWPDTAAARRAAGAWSGSLAWTCLAVDPWKGKGSGWARTAGSSMNCSNSKMDKTVFTVVLHMFIYYYFFFFSLMGFAYCTFMGAISCTNELSPVGLAHFLTP